MISSPISNAVRHPGIACLLLGAVSATGFAPLGLWPVTILSLAMLLWFLSRAMTLRAAMAVGYCFGVGHFVVGLNWIAGSFRYQDSMPVWLGWVAVVSLSLYLAVFPAIATAAAWRVGRKRAPSLVLLFAAFWILTEFARATVFTGFAWNPLAVVVVDAAQASRWIGTYGLSGLVVLAAGCLFLAARQDWKPAIWIGLCVLLIGGLAFRSAMVERVRDSQLAQKRAPSPLLRIVQPNIGQQDKYRPGYDAINFRKLEELTGIPGAVPRLILWPEAAIPDYLEEEEWARARIASLMGPKDALLTGGTALMFDKADRIIGARNAVFGVSPSATLIGRYDKAHLVPYGEYLALRWLLEPLGATRLVPGDIDFIPGPGPQTLDVARFGKVGVQICYEIIFSGHVVDRTNRPAFIFNPSNDAWFGRWGPPQHLAQARLRAIEEGLPVVRSTPTGISAIIDADGRIVKSLRYQVAGSIEGHLPSSRQPTLFARFGNLLALAFALFAALTGIALRPRAR